MSFQGISTKHHELFQKIDLFMHCLYDLTGYSKKVGDYSSFCANAVTKTNPNFAQDIKQVIEDFHTYFYTAGHITHMNTGNFEGMSNEYGTGINRIPMGDVMKLVCPIGVIRTLGVYVFGSYQTYKKELGLFEYDNDHDLVTFFERRTTN